MMPTRRGLLDGHLLLVVEVAEEALELAEALVVQCVELDAVAAAGRAGDLRGEGRDVHVRIGERLEGGANCLRLDGRQVALDIDHIFDASARRGLQEGFVDAI